MPTLTIYDKFGTFLEEHNIDSSLNAWIKDNVPSFKESIRPPYSAILNGKEWPYIQHGDKLDSLDHIGLTIEPKWQAVPYIVAAIMAYVAYRAAKSAIPPQSYQNSTPEAGTSIYSASARANTVSPSGVIRDVAGDIKFYPNYICPVRRKYIDHEEWLYMMLGVGEGYYDLRKNNVYIADTSSLSYPNDFFFESFNPNDDVTGNVAHENWYQSKEILDLRLLAKPSDVEGVWTADFSGSSITTYLDGAAETFPFEVGEFFEELDSSNAGLYRVFSLSGASNETATVVEWFKSAVLTQNFLINNVYQADPYRRELVSLGSPTFIAESGVDVSFVRNSGVNWEGPYRLTPENETAQHCEIDVAFKRGLASLSPTNEEIDRTVDISIQWRDFGESIWNVVAGTSFTDNTLSERGYTIDVDFGSAISPEMRFRRVTTDAIASTVNDLVDIVRVKCKLETPVSYPITTAAIRLRGTNALARSAENQINIRGATRKLPTLSEIQAAALGTPFDLTDGENQVPYDISFSQYVGTYDFTGDIFEPQDSVHDRLLTISEDGQYMVCSSGLNMKVFMFDTPFSLEVAAYLGYTRYNSGIGTTSIRMSGSYIIALRQTTVTGRVVDLYQFGSSYDPYTLSVLSTVTVLDLAQSADISADGTRFWIMLQGAVIRQYTMSTPWDVTTATIDAGTLDAGALLGVTFGFGQLQFVKYSGSDPTRIIISGATEMYTLDMTTPGDITTATDAERVFDSPTNGFHCSEENLYTSQADEMQISKYDIIDTRNTRTSRSIIRYAANAIYSALGSEVTNAVDWTVLESLDTLLNARGDYLDAEFATETTLWEAIRVMLTPGYCEPVIKEGQFSPIRDAAGTDYEHKYSPDIMIDDDVQCDKEFIDAQEPDGVDIEYFSSITGSMELVECRLTGDLGLNPKRIQLTGVTDEQRAWRYGMRQRRLIRNKPDSYSFTTELDALNSNYGDPIMLASGLFGSQYGSVLSVASEIVTLDFEPEFGIGTYYAVFRQKNGRASAVIEIAAGASANEIELINPTSLGFAINTDDDHDDTYVSLGLENEVGLRAIVRRILPQSDDTVRVTCEEYIADIYADDDNSPP